MASRSSLPKSLGHLSVLLALGLTVSCGSNASNEKLDAGQRKYCNVSGVDSGCDASVDDRGFIDSAGSAQDSASDSSDGPGPDLRSPAVDSVEARAVPLDVGVLDSGGDAPLGDAQDVNGAGGSGGTGGAGGSGGAGGIVGAGGARADAAGVVARDSSDGLVAPDTADGAAPDTSDGAAPDTSDGPAPDISDVAATGGTGGVDGGGTGGAGGAQCAYPAPNSVVVFGQVANPPTINGLAGGSSTLWNTGKFYANPDQTSQVDQGFNFGANTIKNTGGADMFLNELDPTTGTALASFSMGTSSGGNQIGTGVAVDMNNNALVIGSYSNKIQFTASGNTQGVNILKDVVSVNGTAMNFFMVVNGASSTVATAPYIVPVKGQSVDLGTGALIATASNPNVNGFAFCGKTSIGDLGVGIGNNGVTPSGATGGGGMDIIVAVVNDDGSIKWGQQYGGAGDQQCTAIAMDNAGNVYIAGNNGGDLTQFGASFSVTGTLNYVPFVAVLNAADGTVKQAATWGTTGNNAVNAIATDGTKVYIGGALAANTNFGTVSLIAQGKTDAFVVAMDAATLTPSCGVDLGDAANDQQVNALALDPTGATLYVGGAFTGTLSPTTLVSANGTQDGFTMELDTANCSINSCLKQVTEDPAYYPATVSVPAGTQTVSKIAMQGTTMANWWIAGSYASSMSLGSGNTAVSLPLTGGAGTIWYYVAHLLP
jgi:hypothetical protein